MKQQELNIHLESFPSIRMVKWLLLATLLAVARSFAADEPAKPNPIAVSTEAYADPKPLKYPTITYPSAELAGGEEGWVYVRMMIDPEGKPYELELADSTGNKEFERMALKSVQSMTFEPATLGGKPIDASVVLPFIFSIHGYDGVTPAFAKNYQTLMKAVIANDKSAAEVALSTLRAKNLYENAAFGLAKYSFAKLWGTDDEQLRGLRIAVAGNTEPKYLPKDSFLFALRNLFLAQVNAQDFVAALSTWKTLNSLEKDPKVIERIKPIVDKVEALRTDPRPISVRAELREGTWSRGLFRNKFDIKVLSGHVSQVKLYCEKKYVLFLFDPTLEYKVDEKYGKCSIVVVGDGGTNIEFFQKI